MLVHRYDLQNDWVEPQRLWKAQAAMALLAVEHFNERNSSIVDELASAYLNKSSCPLILNETFFDTGYTAQNGVRQYTRSYRDAADVTFEAIVGAARSAVSGPIATLAGIDEIPMISYFAETKGKCKQKCSQNL